MADIKIDMTGVKTPTEDGQDLEFAYREAVESGQFNHQRKVVFINGMSNSGEDHAESALALSWVQMSRVIGVYNASAGGFQDFLQCIGDKNQFDGPLSFSADTKVTLGSLLGRIPEDSARRALSRNKAQVKLFDLLRKPENRGREIFAHSQGNLILSNVLQAIAAVDGASGITRFRVHTFGSPAVNWPDGLVKFEHAFTWDPVTFLAGFDSTFTISKVGMPSGSLNPITHGFLEYLSRDPAFIVNRFRWGGLGVTFDMDEEGLAKSLVAMGTNTKRIAAIFEHLDRKHNSDADDVAVLYVNRIRRSPSLGPVIKADRSLSRTLIRILEEGVTFSDEREAINWLK